MKNEQDFIKSYKTLLSELRVNLNKWGNITDLLIKNVNEVKSSNLC